MSFHLMPPNFPAFFRAKETSIPICLKCANSSRRMVRKCERLLAVLTRGNKPPSRILTETKELNSWISIVMPCIIFLVFGLKSFSIVMPLLWQNFSILHPNSFFYFKRLLSRCCSMRRERSFFHLFSKDFEQKPILDFFSCRTIWSSEVYDNFFCKKCMWKSEATPLLIYL